MTQKFQEKLDTINKELSVTKSVAADTKEALQQTQKKTEASAERQATVLKERITILEGQLKAELKKSKLFSNQLLVKGSKGSSNQQVLNFRYRIARQ